MHERNRIFIYILRNTNARKAKGIEKKKQNYSHIQIFIKKIATKITFCCYLNSVKVSKDKPLILFEYILIYKNKDILNCVAVIGSDPPLCNPAKAPSSVYITPPLSPF